jgi:hypothetical protein
MLEITAIGCLVLDDVKSYNHNRNCLLYKQSNFNYSKSTDVK